MSSLAVTGVTGTIGGLTARRLRDSGHTARLLARDPARAPRLPGCDTARFSYGDHDATRAALDGVDVVLMVSAHESQNRVAQHIDFIDAAREAGVQHIVYTSFVGAGDAAGFLLGRDHGATEQHLRESGLTFTFLRDNFYAEVFGSFAGEDGVIRGPAGSGRVAAVSQRDVAAVAAAVLAEPRSHEGRTYDLTGPQSLTLDEVAAVLSDVTGRHHSFHDETIDEARASRAHYGAPGWLVDAWISTYTAIRDGELERVSDDVPHLLGRPALTLREAVTPTARE